jgi:hypothetical protein
MKKFLYKLFFISAVSKIVSRTPWMRKMVLKSRASRLEAEKTGKRRSFGFLFFKTLIEMIPGGLGPYGIGDAITLLEGIFGIELGGRKLDIIDRIISFAAALIPVVPATPFRESARTIREQLEESVAKTTST